MYVYLLWLDGSRDASKAPRVAEFHGELIHEDVIQPAIDDGDGEQALLHLLHFLRQESEESLLHLGAAAAAWLPIHRPSPIRLQTDRRLKQVQVINDGWVAGDRSEIVGKEGERGEGSREGRYQCVLYYVLCALLPVAVVLSPLYI